MHHMLPGDVEKKTFRVDAKCHGKYICRRNKKGWSVVSNVRTSEAALSGSACIGRKRSHDSNVSSGEGEERLVVSAPMIKTSVRGRGKNDGPLRSVVFAAPLY